MSLPKDDFSAVIPNEQTTSNAVKLGPFVLCGLFIPAEFTGTTITFTASRTVDGTYLPVYNSAGAVSCTVAPSRYVAVNPDDFRGVEFLKIVSGSSEGAERTVYLAGRKL